jgi:ATP-dependent exoDNAse (exonuclease V) alpha subunit
MLGSVLRIERDEAVPNAWKTAIRMDDEEAPYEGWAAEAGFRGGGMLGFFRAPRVKKKTIDFFDFGYALTVHKAQGSESPHVAVFLERVWTGDVWKRWLYTAVTRARETLLLIG